MTDKNAEDLTFKSNEEVVMSIVEWEAYSPIDRSEYLRKNRLYLKRYIKIKEMITDVVLVKYDDSVIVK